MESQTHPSAPRRFSGKGEESIYLGAAASHAHLLDKNHDRRVVWLLLFTPLWTLLFTAVPVMIKFHGIGAHIYRFVEPIVGIPLNYFILASSDVFLDYSEAERKLILGTSEKGFLSLLFMIGAAIYAQGAGIHWAGVAAKQKLVQLRREAGIVQGTSQQWDDALHFMREDLEHVIGHYLYALGAIIFSLAHILAYKRQRHDTITNPLTLIVWLLGSVFYAFLIAGVAIEFPKGTIVGLVYTIVVGFPLLGFIVRTRHFFTRGRRLVLQYYTVGNLLALVLIISWIATNGGFIDRKSAGLFR